MNILLPLPQLRLTAAVVMEILLILYQSGKEKEKN
jgi:hypothetical protein